MAFAYRRVKHIGSLRGTGYLGRCGADTNFGSVTYEIDGFSEGAIRRGDGRVQGAPDVLTRAHDASGLRLQLEDGRSLEVTLGKSSGKDEAEIHLTAGFPA